MHHRALRMKGKIQQHIQPANHLLVGWLHGLQNEESGGNWGWGEHLFQLFRSSSLTTPTCLASPDPGRALAPIDGTSSYWNRRGADSEGDCEPLGLALQCQPGCEGRRPIGGGTATLCRQLQDRVRNLSKQAVHNRVINTGLASCRDYQTSRHTSGL
jgi:hypothetical protein